MSGGVGNGLSEHAALMPAVDALHTLERIFARTALGWAGDGVAGAAVPLAPLWYGAPDGVTS